MLPNCPLRRTRVGEKNKRDVNLSAVPCRTAAKASKVLPNRAGYLVEKRVLSLLPAVWAQAASNPLPNRRGSLQIRQREMRGPGAMPNHAGNLTWLSREPQGQHDVSTRNGMPSNGFCVVARPHEPARFFSPPRKCGNIASEQEKPFLLQACTTLSGYPLGMTLRDWLRSKT